MEEEPPLFPSLNDLLQDRKRVQQLDDVLQDEEERKKRIGTAGAMIPYKAKSPARGRA